MTPIFEFLFNWVISHIETVLVALFVVIREIVMRRKILDFEKIINLDIKRKEHQYSISKDSLNTLFHKKIETYENLLLIISEYEIKMNETDKTYYREADEYGYEGHFDNHAIEYYNLSKKIKDIITPNRLVISEELLNKYDDLYELQVPFFHRFNYGSEEGLGADDYDSLYKRLELKTKKHMHFLISQIKKDVTVIRSHIDIREILKK